MSDYQSRIRAKLALLPEKPGCYMMKNEQNKIIYVGKAKVLRNRVRSYFSGSHDTKTQKMVSEIRDFEYMVTANDVEALILECNLIKKHRPRYNVLLTDDKSYPYIKITSEEHPRLIVTRKVQRDTGKYFGPYTSAFSARQTKKLLDRLYPLRKCNQLPDEVCLYYHIGQCLAPCVRPVAKETYEQMVKEITRFLGGGHVKIRQELERQMHEAAERLEFEKARELRDQIAHIDAVMEKQSMTDHDEGDRDIFGFAAEKGWMSVHILFMRQGKVVGRHAAAFPFYGEEYEDFVSYVTQYYSDNPVIPREILLPDHPRREDAAALLQSWLKVKVHVPRRGTKRRLVETAIENAAVALDEKFRLLERDEERTTIAAQKLGEWLGLGAIRRIEAFDNSNIQGANPVSAMVVFIDGKPAKKEYRKYKIKTVEGQDDAATMREVIRRRYERVLKENLPLPDLIIVDGGKAQMNAANDVLENELGLSIPVCGLVKDQKHKTSQLLIGNPPQMVDIPRDRPEFYLLQRIQEEVHRFAIAFHREIRGKSLIASRLDEIPGVGKKRRALLLKHFGSLKKIREADVADFREIGIGPKLAETIIRALRADSAQTGEADRTAQAPQ